MKFVIIFLLLVKGIICLRFSKPNLTFVGETTAESNKFPFMVGVQHNSEKPKKTFFCGGSLLSNEWVLTAAHCAFLAKSVTVFLGDIHFRRGTSYKIQVEDVKIHKKFNPFSLLNDICLIKIPYTKYSDAIKSIKLPFTNEKHSYSGAKATAIRWGRKREGAKHAKALQYAKRKVIRNTKCKLYDPNLEDTHLCVLTTESITPCTGDSGGPLVYKSLRGLVQIGVHSKCSLGRPVRYTRVSKYLKWIKDTSGIERRNSSFLERGKKSVGIVNGKNAKPNQFPYMALVESFSFMDDVPIASCGGTLISNKWILSAAHCMDSADFVQVHLGDIHFGGGIEYEVLAKNVHIHKEYQEINSLNDICVIQIPYTRYSDSIQNIRLPLTILAGDQFEDEKVLISGWGTTHDQEFADILQYTELSVMKNQDCRKRSPYYTKEHICVATADKKTIGMGDSGGPLAYKSLTQGLIQIGIVSFLNTSDPVSPIYCVRVTSYLNWIRDKTGISY